MPDNDFDEFFSDIDAPRPLPTSVRQRLEETLLARPLPPEVSQRLAERLSPAQPRRSLWARAARSPWMGAAAALVIAGGVAAALSIPGGGSGSAPTASKGLPTRPSGAASASQSAGTPSPAQFGALNASTTTNHAATNQGAASGGSSGGAAGGASASGAGASTGASAPGAAPAVAPSTAPAVTSVSPAGGPVTGGTWVTINGSNLAGTTAVRFGAAAAQRFQVVSGTEVRALSPAHAPGPVYVVVATPRGSSGPSVTFTYGA
jgi:hypothetical protein